MLDTQDLDVFAMEQVTCRWVRVQLTVAQDLFTRCIVGLRVTPVSTKAVDVAGVLYDAIVPQPAPSHWPDSACWPYHGVPDAVVFDESARWRGPVCAPETLVVDHGKVFLSAHVISVCTRLGISIQPAQPHKPTDKPTVERFFKTLREGLIQHLPAYKGPDVHSRGLRVADEAFLFVHELEDVIREWVAGVYHLAKHDGLSVPEWPHLALSPAEMFAIGVGRAGLLRIPVDTGAGLRLPAGGGPHDPALRRRGERVALQRSWPGRLPQHDQPLRRRPGREVADPDQPGRRPLRLVPGPGRRGLAPPRLGTRAWVGVAVLRRGGSARPPAGRGWGRWW